MDSGEHNDKNLREHCFAEILYNQWSKKIFQLMNMTNDVNDK